MCVVLTVAARRGVEQNLHHSVEVDIRAVNNEIEATIAIW